MASGAATPVAPAASPERRAGRATRLPPRVARVLYNVADAWLPPGADCPGAADFDLVPAVERRLGGGRERLELALVLALLEWEPRLRLRSLRGFSWLARPQRRALLADWERSPLGPRRRAAVWLRGLLQAALVECRTAAAQEPPSAVGETQPFGGP
jgi:hypothetical protein